MASSGVFGDLARFRWNRVAVTSFNAGDSTSSVLSPVSKIRHAFLFTEFCPCVGLLDPVRFCSRHAQVCLTIMDMTVGFAAMVHAYRQVASHWLGQSHTVPRDKGICTGNRYQYSTHDILLFGQ